MSRRPPRSPLFPYPPLFRFLTADDLPARPRRRWRRRRRHTRLEYTANPAWWRRRRWWRRLQIDTLEDRKSTRLNSSHQIISYAVFCLKKKKKKKAQANRVSI